MKSIESFRREYRFLSNFYPVEVRIPIFTSEGVLDFWERQCPSVEHAYQAAKAKRSIDRIKIAAATDPSIAKKMGREIEMRDDWLSIRIPVMRDLIEQKFIPGTELTKKLLATDGIELIEGNYWNDTFWGICRNKGENWLGRLLMEHRQKLKEL